MADKDFRRMSAEEFVRRLRLTIGQDDTHFLFWIGAGCSISSGIPGAASLVAERWLPQLQQVRGEDGGSLENWAQGAFPGFDLESAAEKYGEVMEELFIHPEPRQREIEDLCDGNYPGFGYAVLASLLARKDGLFNVALTTNFDDLIADAMYVFTDARPLVITDEALAAYIRPTRMRPLVVKVHGDNRLSPRNTRAETSALKKGISEGIRNLLHDRGVIFIGYGGHDKGIATLLQALPRQALPLGVWWVNPVEPSGVLRPWLEARDAIWVQAQGFDELMLLFRDQFELAHPDSKKFEQLFTGYVQTYQKLSDRVERMSDADPDAAHLKDAAARANAAATDWSAAFLEASRLSESDPKKAAARYRRGIREFPESGILFAGYANLLSLQGRFAEALEVLESATKVSGDVFVEEGRGQVLLQEGRFDEGQAAFERAIELAPREPRLYGQLGVLFELRGDDEAAERELKRTIDLQPTDSVALAPLALLFDELEYHQAAAEAYERCLSQDPANPNARANYARCLIALRRIGDAKTEAERALEELPPWQGPVLLEVFFYQFAVGESDEQDKALARIKELVKEGHQLGVWDLSDVIAYGGETSHPDAEWLEPLARVIAAEAPAESLAGWRRWASA